MKKLIALGMAGLMGCISEPIDSGYIVEKRYEPGREYTHNEMWLPDPPMYITGQYLDDEDFIITLGKKGDKNRTRMIFVSEEVYNSFNVGDFINVTKVPHEDSDFDTRTE